MKKENLICFRSTKALHDSLVEIAKEERRSLSSMIEMALSSYLKERKALQGVAKEKRQFQRKALSVPVVVNQKELGLMAIGAISEISLGGVRLLISNDFKHQISIESQGSKFEIVLNLPAENKPIRLFCESQRIINHEESVHIGASFIDADFKSYKALQSYLM